MTIDIALLWLPSLLISIISLSIFIYLSYRNRQKIDALTQQSHDYSLQQVEHFLQREAQATRQRIKLAIPTPDTPTQSIDKLRLIWLEAELTALVDQGKRRSNHQLLLHAVQPIVRLISRPAAPATNNNAIKQAAVVQLEKARRVLASQNETIVQYRQNITTMKRDEKPIQKTIGFDTALGTVEQNGADLASTITRLESELAALQQKLNAAEQYTQPVLTSAAAVAPSADILVVSTPTPQGDKLSVARALLNATDQAYRQSVTEIGRMREINSQQRELILQLEKELMLVRKDTEQYDASLQMLDKLKLQLRDYETCTVILEEEADSLRGKIDELHKAIAHDQETHTESAREIPAQAIAAPPVVPIKSRFESLSLLAEIMALETAQAIAAKLTEWLQQQKQSAVVFIREESEQIWASSEGGVDTHSKQLLQSIVAVPDQPRFDVGEGLLFAYPVCRVLIYQNSALNDNDGGLAQHLQLIIKIVDRWLALLQTKQLANNDSRNDDLYNQLNGLLAQYKYISTEHGRLGEKFHAELNHFFSSTEITLIQQRVVTTMLEDHAAQLDIIGKASKLIYTRLKTIAEDMESSNTFH
jgi:hypothetical protein